MPIIGNIGTTEWIIIAILILVFFGGDKLQEFARGLGESGKEFKRLKKEFHSAVTEIQMDDVADIEDTLEEKEEKDGKKKKGKRRS
jgi:TatA/E family protein of Tat protein translocase